MDIIRAVMTPLLSILKLYSEGTFARRAPGAPGAPGIQMNVLAIYHNALPPIITPSSSPGIKHIV